MLNIKCPKCGSKGTLTAYVPAHPYGVPYIKNGEVKCDWENQQGIYDSRKFAWIECSQWIEATESECDFRAEWNEWRSTLLGHGYDPDEELEDE